MLGELGGDYFQRHLDIAAGGIGIRANLVGLGDELFSLLCGNSNWSKYMDMKWGHKIVYA